MHLVLTDVLMCPRCGSGLIVMADRMEGRQIMDGQLGCPGCRTNYSVRAGAADLRTAPGAASPSPCEFTGDSTRLLALTGVMEARGFVLLLGDAACAPEQFVGIVPNLQLVTVNAPSTPLHETISALLVDGPLPMTDGSMRGVVLTGTIDAVLLRECARVAAIGARIVIEGPSASRAETEQTGLRVLAAERLTVVATRTA